VYRKIVTNFLNIFSGKFGKYYKFVNLCTMDYKKKVQDSGRTITWLAKEIGISRVLLSNYINKNRSMPEKVQHKLLPLVEQPSLITQKS
jgi:DNA transposition AAA+ family ATPase